MTIWWPDWTVSSLTHPYKKVDHKKYIECQINLLGNIVTPLLTSLHLLTRRIDKVYNEGCDAEYKHEDHLQMHENIRLECISLFKKKFDGTPR